MTYLLRGIALIYGMIFICFGAFGFVSCLAPDHVLFGLFFVSPLTNTVHLLTGLGAICAGAKSNLASKIFFQLAGFVYALITVLGFACGEKNFLGILANNMADTWVNLLIAMISLYFGFCIKIKQNEKSS
jgi:hypothetical protein